MPNAYLTRSKVHAWSEDIGQNPLQQQSALTRLLKQQRRLSKFIDENGESMDRATAGVTTYLVGVVIRLFDLAGGRMRQATWEQIRNAEKRIANEFESLFPLDDQFPDRVRAIGWRAQPHILDEALMALFQRDRKSGEADLLPEESLKVFFLLWVCTEVLDENWAPAAGFDGVTTYAYEHVEEAAAS